MVKVMVAMDLGRVSDCPRDECDLESPAQHRRTLRTRNYVARFTFLVHSALPESHPSKCSP